MGLIVVAASSGVPASKGGDLIPALAMLAASVLLVGLLSLGAIVFMRWRRLPRRTSSTQAQAQDQLPDAWVEAGRRMKE